MALRLRWPFRRKPPVAGVGTAPVTLAEAATLGGQEPHGIEVDPALGDTLTRHAQEAATLPRLGPQAGLRQVARTLAGAEEFASSLTAPSWSGEVARWFDQPAASGGDFTSHLGSLASLRDPWGTGTLGDGGPFAETLAPAESGAVFATPWAAGGAAAGGRVQAGAVAPPRVAARLATTAPATARQQPGLIESGGTWSAPPVPPAIPPTAVRMVQPLRDAGAEQAPSGPSASENAASAPPVAAPEGPESPVTVPAVAKTGAGVVERPGTAPAAIEQPPAPGPEHPAFDELPLAAPSQPHAGEPAVQRAATATTAPGPAADAALPSPASPSRVRAEPPAAAAAPAEPATAGGPVPRTPTKEALEAPPAAPPVKLLTPAEMLITPGLLPPQPEPGAMTAPRDAEAPMTLFSPPGDEPGSPPAVQRTPSAPAMPPAADAGATSPAFSAPAEPGARFDRSVAPASLDLDGSSAPPARGEALPAPEQVSPPGPFAAPMPLAEPFAAPGGPSRHENAAAGQSAGGGPAMAPTERPPTRPAASVIQTGTSDLELYSPASFAQVIVRRYVEAAARGPAVAVATAGRLVARYVTRESPSSGGPPPAHEAVTRPSRGPAQEDAPWRETGATPVFQPSWEGTPAWSPAAQGLAVPEAPLSQPWAGAAGRAESAPAVQRQAMYAAAALPAARMPAVSTESPAGPAPDLPLAPVAASAPAGPVQLYREAPRPEGEASGTVAQAGTQPAGGEQAGQSENIEHLADRVWQIVRRRLQIERERQRGLP